jgi:3,4-dehydroadipyl-CoA semialdehyde dehydrogenase
MSVAVEGRSKMDTLKSYVQDRWVAGTGAPSILLNPTTEEPVAEVAAGGIEVGAALHHARTVGGPALRAMTFAERGAMLRSLAEAIVEQRIHLLDLSMKNNGATRGDAKFDVDGASFALTAYAELGESLGDRRWFVEGEVEELLRSRKLGGLHVKTARRGVAVHVNAFNFPAWGMAGKAAVALLAGMPVVSKPATSTAWTAFHMGQAMVDAGVLPAGAFTFIAGRPEGMLDHLTTGDALAFTGSGAVGSQLRRAQHLADAGVPINVEADSVNAAVIGPDVEPGEPTWDMSLRHLSREITQKAGQKCTTVRRILVPSALVDEFTDNLASDLGRTRIGDPYADGVRMGPLVSARQRDDVLAGIARLGEQLELVRGAGRPAEVHGVDEDQGFFVDSHLFRASDPQASLNASAVHGEEVFGPVATILPYDGTVAQAASLVALGQGGLMAAVYSDDRAWTRDMVLELTPWSGRVFLGSEKVAESMPGPGAVLPQLLHGGPGRAGGGEELGGPIGLDFYLQRSALQGYRPLLERLFDGV